MLLVAFLLFFIQPISIVEEIRNRSMEGTLAGPGKDQRFGQEWREAYAL